MVKEERKQLKQLDLQTLKNNLEEQRRAYFGLRLNATTSGFKDYSQFKKMRKNIARILTILKQKEMNAQ